MSLESNLIFLVIFGLVGFVIGKIWGVNPSKIYGNITAFIFMLLCVFFILSAMQNPEAAVERLPVFLENVLPGAIVGDVAGTFVASLTGKRD